MRQNYYESYDYHSLTVDNAQACSLYGYESGNNLISHNYDYYYAHTQA